MLTFEHLLFSHCAQETKDICFKLILCHECGFQSHLIDCYNYIVNLFCSQYALILGYIVCYKFVMTCRTIPQVRTIITIIYLFIFFCEVMSLWRLGQLMCMASMGIPFLHNYMVLFSVSLALIYKEMESSLQISYMKLSLCY